MKTPIRCAIALLLVASCARNSNVGTTTVTSAGATPTDAAASRLTKERCDRELTCNRIGEDRDFVNRDECTRELGRDTRMQLRADLCPEGVDEAKLSTCLAELGSKRCGYVLHSVDDVASCHYTALCIVRVMPARETTSPF